MHRDVTAALWLATSICLSDLEHHPPGGTYRVETVQGDSTVALPVALPAVRPKV